MEAPIKVPSTEGSRALDCKLKGAAYSQDSILPGWLGKLKRAQMRSPSILATRHCWEDTPNRLNSGFGIVEICPAGWRLYLKQRRIVLRACSLTSWQLWSYSTGCCQQRFKRHISTFLLNLVYMRARGHKSSRRSPGSLKLWDERASQYEHSYETTLPPKIV